jgi:hypothetical protein
VNDEMKTTKTEQETKPRAPEANGRRRIRRARWIGIALVVVFGGIVAAMAGALPDGVIGRVLAYGVLAFILLLVLARFVPDRWLGGRVGRARARNR